MRSVTMVDLKRVHKVHSHGRTYYYAWRGGPRIEGEPGSTEFFQSLDAARDPMRDADRRKFKTWAQLYKASPEFKALADSTRYRWGRWIDRIIDEFGDLSVRQFDRPAFRSDIKHWRDTWRESPRTADYGKQVLSGILSYMVEEGAIVANICKGIKNLYRVDRSDIIWLDDDIKTLCAVASPEVGFALRLACLTGLRQGDLLKLSWSHIRANAIELRTRKSRGWRKVLIPLYGDLRALLDAIPKRSTRVLTNSDGVPWRGFGSSWNKAMIDSGLTEKKLHFHDARGTAVTKLYTRANFSNREIAEIVGWSEEDVDDMINRYVKRDEILRDRIRRLDEA